MEEKTQYSLNYMFVRCWEVFISLQYEDLCPYGGLTGLELSIRQIDFRFYP